jgi:hypothetical protein
MQRNKFGKWKKNKKGDKKKRTGDFFQRLFTQGKEPQSFTNIRS